MARKDSFNQPWASVPAQFERPGDGLIARGWAGGASEDPPEAKWENWWHNRVDLALQELQNLGQLIWFVDAPYKAGARVNYGGNSFIALSNNTGVEPTGLLDVGVWRKESTKTYLQTANNLSEIKAAGPVAVAQAIDNLGLKDTAATAAGALQKTQNLNDVANKATALANLGALAANGTAAAATKLATARTIAGKSFNGTANISIAAEDIGALAANGTAFAATKLATARTIAGKPFDGTANISIGAADVGALSVTGGTTTGAINITNITGAAFSIKSKNEGDVLYLMAVSDTASKSRWYMGNTIENDTTLHIVNSKTAAVLNLGDTISSSVPFSALGTITPSNYSNFDERYEPALIGTPMPWPLTTAPAGYLKCNGASFNKTQYPKLALAYPSGVLPDLRGEFIRGFDDGRGVRPNQALLGWQGSEIQSHNHSITNFEIRGTTGGPTNAWFPSANGISTNNSGGDETRPRNVAFNYIVRAL
ncbi:phage tail protein [Yersinia kristensenii]|uniref:phage tail protein n=1 Tax=Yersinia kristensenii TaxID=28152 RepID=UPI001643AFCB|nr:phage tail protein [Yersinia kristensenii]MBW5814493.1 tail fiber protein [Yersinia kristensenii]MBW5831627.1 tail fiber protein [Yersinia kristensenii]